MPQYLKAGIQIAGTLLGKLAFSFVGVESPISCHHYGDLISYGDGHLLSWRDTMETAVEPTIRREIQRILLEDGLDETEYVSSTFLGEIGLDSLGFAILIARLEKEFGFDPFTESGIVAYPQTFGEFLSAYENFRAQQI